MGGASPADLTLASTSGFGPIQPIGGGSQVVLEGGLNDVSSITVSGTQLILAPLGNPVSSYSSLGSTGLPSRCPR